MCFLILCIIQLFYLFYFRSDFKYEVIKNPLDKNSGIEFPLLPEIIESNNILTKYEVTNFNLSDVLKNNTYFYQRSVEFNYPIRMKETSQFTFFIKNEKFPSNCTILETGKYLKLIKC